LFLSVFSIGIQNYLHTPSEIWTTFIW